MMDLTRYSIEDLLPHRGDMLLIDRVVHFAGSELEAHAIPKLNNLFVSNRNAAELPAWVGIELMAQAVAAYVGLLARAEGRPPPIAGYLLGTRRYEAKVPYFSAEHVLRIQTHCLYRDPSGLGGFGCVIWQGDAKIAEAEISVYEPSATELQKGSL